MNRHVWLTKRFANWAVLTGLQAYQHALSNGTSVSLACCFTGYVLETQRQQGMLVQHYRQLHWRNVDLELEHSITGIWERGRAGKYARGKNAANYQLVGRRVLYQHLSPSLPAQSLGQELLMAFRDGADCDFALHDWLEEHGYSIEAALFRTTPSKE